MTGGKPTPGEWWFVDDSTDDDPLIHIMAGDGKDAVVIASTIDFSLIEGREEANARMMAASKNLYEALELAVGALAYFHGEEWETVKIGRAALSRALALKSTPSEQIDGWQPIDTAPRNSDTPIDLWSADFGRHTDCVPEKDGWLDDKGDIIPADWATHWRYPPSPPKAGE